MNLPAKLYRWLILNQNLTLMSGSSQSVGGKRVWQSLAHLKGIFVAGYDEKRKQLFQLDPDNLDNEYIYDSEIEEDIDDLLANRKELQNDLDNIKPNQIGAKHKRDTLYNEIREINTKMDDLYHMKHHIYQLRLVAMKTKGTK